MNIAATYLAGEWERLGLRRLGSPRDLDWVAITPRFRASAHVVFLAVADGATDPVLVAKIARVPGRSPTLDHEAAMLRMIQATRPGGFDSAPRLVSEGVVEGTHMLVETGLAGRPIDASTVRRAPESCSLALLEWVIDLHLATLDRDSYGQDAFTRLVEEPLDFLGATLPRSFGMDALLVRTRELLSPLQSAELPLVMAHGDLGAPNLLMSRAGELGVVDWELAEAASLPAQDLFFALAYVAFARAGAHDTTEYVDAFNSAFFVRDAWTEPFIARYAAATRLSDEVLHALFVACWVRYVAARAARLHDDTEDASLDAETASWLMQDRYVALWQHAVRHADELCLSR